MARVFISYAREDGKPFAESLAAALQDHEVWFDRRDLTPGVSWEHEIEQGIERCDVFLAVLTRAYRRAGQRPPQQRIVGADRQREMLHHRVHAGKKSDAERGDAEGDGGGVREASCDHGYLRHCERSEAIQSGFFARDWIASSLRSSQ